MPGTFIFRPLEAHLTHVTEWFTRIDPYCVFIVGNRRYISNVCNKGGIHPYWEESIKVHIQHDPTITIEVMDKERLFPDEHIGYCIVDLEEIESYGRLKKWYPLELGDNPAGEFLLEATFEPDLVPRRGSESYVTETERFFIERGQFGQQSTYVEQIKTNEESRIASRSLFKEISPKGIVEEKLITEWNYPSTLGQQLTQISYSEI